MDQLFMWDILWMHTFHSYTVIITYWEYLHFIFCRRCYSNCLFRLDCAQIVLSSKLTFLLLFLLLCCFSCQGSCLHLLLQGLQLTLIVLWGERRYCVGGQTKARTAKRHKHQMERQTKNRHIKTSLSQANNYCFSIICPWKIERQKAEANTTKALPLFFLNQQISAPKTAVRRKCSGLVVLVKAEKCGFSGACLQEHERQTKKSMEINKRIIQLHIVKQKDHQHHCSVFWYS